MVADRARGRRRCARRGRRSSRPRRPPPSPTAGTRGVRAGRARRPARRAGAAPGRFASASVSATCARWPPESWPTFFRSGRRRRSIRARGGGVVPARVELAAELERLGDGEAAVERMVLADEADAAAAPPRPRRAASGRGRALAGRWARRGRSRGGGGSSCRRRSGRRAPSPSRPGSRACSRAAPRATRSACRGRGSRARAGGAHAALARGSSPCSDLGEERRDPVVVEAGGARPVDPAPERRCAVRPRRRAAATGTSGATNVPWPRRPSTIPSRSSSR